MRPERFQTLVTVVSLATTALVGCVPPADGPPETFGHDFSMPGGTRTDGALVFVVDGVNAETFERMLAGGELPAIERYFVARGLYAPRAVANVPSVTLANLTSIATGVWPGHHGVTGINWFDRDRLIWRDYTTIAQKNTLDGDYVAPTLFERLSGRTSFSVFFQPHRGASKFIENWTSAGPPYFFGWYEFVDRLTLYRLDIVAEVARQRREWPGVTVCYLLAPDFRGYGYGASSPQYRQALRHTDRQIGRVLGDLDRAGLLQTLHIVLISDHGMVDVERHFPLERFLRDEAGLDVARAHLWDKTPFRRRLDYYRDYSCVYYGSGDRYAAICLRKPLRAADGKVTGFAAWPVRPDRDDLLRYPRRDGFKPRDGRYNAVSGDTVNLLEMLTLMREVQAVAYRVAPNRVRLICTGGSEVEFRQERGRGGPIRYRCITGDDPLGWRGVVPEALLTGQPASPRAWLTATVGGDYADLPAQLLAYFRAPRAGDLAVFAAPGWDFSDQHAAGHGGLTAGEMHVPFLLAGPGVPHGRLDTARTVDLVPTLLQLLNGHVPAGMDGRSLVGEE
ncbi:MAG: alkaline phosphatase family protein [Phycisphaerae bacterium]|nr:alkaline phosphatase family protein [Phycisphaerae bacterium]